MNKCNTIIIDDLIDVYEANRNNTIRAPEFDVLENDKAPSKEYQQKMVNDTFLFNVMMTLDKKIASLSRMNTDGNYK